MTGAQFGQFVLALLGVAVVVAIVVWLLHWLYLRSSKERAFVRTGFGGQKVVMNGGALVLPIIHEVIPVNMNTLRLEVTRGRERALITKDRMRVDVTSEFYVRVQAGAAAIAAAAQTLGDLGFSGIQNFPTVGLFDGVIRAQLEETGMGYGLEVQLVEHARKLDLLTTPYVFSEQNARDMAEAGADIVVCHLGLTAGGSVGARTALQLRECVPLIDAWAKAAREVNPEILVLCHGGPIASPEDARFILENCRGCNGFYGASSLERLPAEAALIQTTRKFKRIGVSLKEKAS